MYFAINSRILYNGTVLSQYTIKLKGLKISVVNTYMYIHIQVNQYLFQAVSFLTSFESVHPEMNILFFICLSHYVIIIQETMKVYALIKYVFKYNVNVYWII